MSISAARASSGTVLPKVPEAPSPDGSPLPDAGLSNRNAHAKHSISTNSVGTTPSTWLSHARNRPPSLTPARSGPFIGGTRTETRASEADQTSSNSSKDSSIEPKPNDAGREPTGNSSDSLSGATPAEPSNALFSPKSSQFTTTAIPATAPAEHQTDGLEVLEDTVRHYVTETGSLQCIPAQREKLERRRGASFTIMVCGESSSGKSTFVRTLIGGPYRKTHRPTARNAGMLSNNSLAFESRTGSPSHLKTANGNMSSPSFVHRTAEIEVHEIKLKEGDFETRLTVVDTPGFGDYTNNQYTWAPVTNYIDSQHLQFMCEEEQPDRSRLVDTRVHACLYFLQPTGHDLHDMDIEAMQELGKRVNLIPVIAKADSMTRDDLARFKQTIRNALKTHQISVYSPSPEVAAEWPYGIVASDSLVTIADGRQVRGREFKWGVVEVENPEHSDFLAVRKLLLEQHMLDLIDTTASVHYSRQRRDMRLLRLRRALNLPGSPMVPPKLLPSNRPSITFLSNGTPVKQSTPSEPSIESIAAEMTGLEIVAIISQFGSRFLQSIRLNRDALFEQRTIELRNQFTTVRKFQEAKFDARMKDIELQRDEYLREINETQADIDKLTDTIQALELSRRKK